MKITCETRIKTQIMDVATGLCVKERPWEKNLILDTGLNALAGGANSTYGAGCFTDIYVGSGTTPTSTASGAITFTQATNQLTASGGFFTVGMVGMLFKYGTGTAGAEYYITAFTSSTLVTVDTSITVATPTVGTVWAVNQTALVTKLHSGTSYQTLTGDNSTVLTAGGVITHQRKIIIAPQGTTYTVNEIGYNKDAINTGTTNPLVGRIVLSSSDVITTSQYYLVTIQLVITYSPATPTAVANVGTNINTAGNAMIETLTNFSVIGVVNSNGTASGAQTLDYSVSIALVFATQTYSQNGSPGSAFNWTSNSPITLASVNWANVGSSRGTMTLTFSGSVTTSGQSLYGIAIGGSSSLINADIKFTTTQTAPTGIFQPNTVWQMVFNRALSN